MQLDLTDFELEMACQAVKDYVDELRTYYNWVNDRPALPLAEQALKQIKAEEYRYSEFLYKLFKLRNGA